jgi:YHS domain-containing protein
MSQFRSGKPLAFAVTLALAILGVTAVAAEEVAATPAPALARVEAKRVCMVNNQVFERDMIPVEFEGKTYFGCCDMCKKTLAQSAEARTAVDPITGNAVDKATAIFGALPDHTVLYFESEATFAEYAKKNG